MTRSATFLQTGRTVPLKAAQPFADRGHAGGEQPSGGLDATVLGALHQAQVINYFVVVTSPSIPSFSCGGHAYR